MVWLVCVQIENNLVLFLTCNFISVDPEIHYKVNVIANEISEFYSFHNKSFYLSHFQHLSQFPADVSM